MKGLLDAQRDHNPQMRIAALLPMLLIRLPSPYYLTNLSLCVSLSASQSLPLSSPTASAPPENQSGGPCLHG